MKCITKQAEPILFKDWKTKNPGLTYKDLSDPKDADATKAKSSLKSALLAEQKNICCYCECRISAHTSHIEHFKPKGNSLYKHLQLDFSNLHASCMIKPTGDEDEHCGHKKGNVFSADLISPLESDCAVHFTYNLNGEIGFSDRRGEQTIKILHLDSALLNCKRKSLIDYFLDLDESDVTAEVRHHLTDDENDLGEFYTMIGYLNAKGQL